MSNYTSDTRPELRETLPDYEIRIRYSSMTFDNVKRCHPDDEMYMYIVKAVMTCGCMFNMIYLNQETETVSSGKNVHFNQNIKYDIGVTGDSLPVRGMAFHLSKLAYHIGHLVYGSYDYEMYLYSFATGREITIWKDQSKPDYPDTGIMALRLAALRNCTQKWLSDMDIVEKAWMFCRAFGVAGYVNKHPDMKGPCGISDKFMSKNINDDFYTNGICVRIKSSLTNCDDLWWNSTGCNVYVFKYDIVRPSGEFVVCQAHGIIPSLYAEDDCLLVLTEVSADDKDCSVAFTAELIPSDHNYTKAVAKIAGISIEDAHRYVTQALESAQHNV